MNISTDAGHSGWTTVQKLLHWVIAAAVIYQLSLGFGLDDFADDDPQRLEVVRLHATLGLTILVLMLVRLGWRLTHAIPSPPMTISPTLARAARAIHLAFYVALIILPLSGLLLVAASGETVPLVGTDLPGFGPASDTLRATLWYVHATFAIAISLMVLGHIGAAVHHAFKRDGTFSRMIPGR
jgi:cytochrome b561